MRVVVNTSPFIALDRIGQLDLLKALYGTVVRPQSVVDELLAGEARYLVDDDDERTGPVWLIRNSGKQELASLPVFLSSRFRSASAAIQQQCGRTGNRLTRTGDDNG